VPVTTSYGLAENENQGSNSQVMLRIQVMFVLQRQCHRKQRGISDFNRHVNMVNAVNNVMGR